ncbi:acyl-CoA dehydrogenase family protein [Actinomadura harenae]|uniref:Acyl-CoA dehydrogenase n=1 Tax=Actinomadura harenae TaxID=2483351 RepID=A0A3M2LR32_9ACTN|nr:acyl-CoA dehydrogenase family protein [Actinomadura harenae]RMI38555.1 acyl-CoA dehydrogenase [Actinomadura harenae]
MIELDERLTVLQGHAREWARDLRPLALDLERDPELVHGLLDRPGLAFLARAAVPAAHNPDPIVLDGHLFDGMGGLERVTFVEEFAACDTGMLLAAPGSSLSGIFVALLGDEEQKRWFYGRLLERPTWSFFALTEPDRGSDAPALESTLTPAGPEGGPLLLNGTKRFIGNAARAAVGMVFARVRPGPLGIVSVLVDTAAPGFRAEPFPTVGLKGNQVSEVVFTDLEVPAERVLGRHLSATRRGLAGAVQGFNRLRPGVAALGVGIARGALDYVLEHRSDLTSWERDELDRVSRRIAGVRQLVRRAGVAMDENDPMLGYLASMAKARAARLAEDVTLAMPDYFGPGARWEHPLLDKYARDARGVEFMEGTSNIQNLTVFQGLSQNRLGVH